LCEQGQALPNCAGHCTEIGVLDITCLAASKFGQHLVQQDDIT
jgi:hypothetical protein